MAIARHGPFACVRAATRTMTALAVGTLLALSLNPVVEAAEGRFNVSRPYAVGVVFAALALASPRSA